MQLRNHTEEIVKYYVDKIPPTQGVCTCEVCKMDIMALMLNNLKPHYVVSDTGALYAQMKEFDFQHQADVIAALTSAIETVKVKPRH